MKELNGQITAKSRLGGGIDGRGKMRGVVKNAQTKPLPYYEGEYELTPVWEDVTLQTKQKSMSDNVTMQAIPYAEVDNPSGGVTVIIGG